MELLIRPKEEFISKANLEDLQNISRSWITEIKYWQDELDFHIRLIDVFFPTNSKKNTNSAANKTINKLIEFNFEELPALLRNVTLHEFFLGELIKGSSALSKEVYREEHQKVEKEILIFMKAFKLLKTALMSLINETSANNKSKDLNSVQNRIESR